jgi:hypothetical protein
MYIYISGPIAGKENGNKEAFRTEEQWIKSQGFTGVNPHSMPHWPHTGDCPEGYAFSNGHSSCCWLRGDLIAMLKCNAVLMLEDWHGSKGAALEREVARMCGIPILESRQHFLTYFKVPRG